MLLPALRAGAIAGMGGDKSADPYNELQGQLRALLTESPNDDNG